MPSAERRAFMVNYASAAVESGRLTPQAALEEALEVWNKHVQARELLTALIDKMDREDSSCRVCGAELGTIHAAWCERSNRP